MPGSQRMSRLGLAAAVTLAFAGIWVDSAFIAVQQPTVSRKVLQVGRAQAHHATAVSLEHPAPHGGLGASACVGAALLWAAAALPAHLSKRKGTRSAKCQVVGCQAAPTCVQVSSAPVPKPAAVVLTPAPIAVTAPPVLLSLVSDKSQEAPEVAPQAIPGPTLRAGLPARGPARFVGGARHAEGRQASAGASAGRERAARRAVGAALQPVCNSSTVPASYDASLVRTKIQMGMRVITKTSPTGRQVSTPPVIKSFGDEEGGCLTTTMTRTLHQVSDGL